MKKLFSILAMTLLAFGAFAADANLMKYVQIYPAYFTTNQVVDGAAVDIAAYKGNATFVAAVGNCATTNAYSCVVTFAHSANGTTGWSTITNLAGTVGTVTIAASTNSAAIGTFAIDLARLHKYVRASISQTPAENGASVAAILVAPMKSE